MPVDIVTKTGRRIGRISDSMDQDDTIVIDGKEVSLEDVYNDEKLKKAFNDHVKEIQDVRREDRDSNRDRE